METNQKLPNATATLVLGILSIPTCCFYGLGLVLGIVALVISKEAVSMYKVSPENYTDYGNVKAGRVTAIIGIILSALYLLLIVIGIVFFGSIEGIQEWAEEMQRANGA
ncbi:MAG: CCC motif membrane protein [Cyclobacteriaceae bacterium]